ncbi:MAG: right-handed parallel beta-helix repeat-containing protein [Cytophagales bacterium]|nr:right-handed parallel beta-helix repeat-containing protein [Cytophagales bacterium]
MKYIHILFLIGWILSSCDDRVTAQNIYVSKDGNDMNDGSESSPYLTLGKAASIAVAGDVVHIGEGTYEETLKPANSGTLGNPIIFQAKEGEKVIISAMQALSGWTQDAGAIYKTTIDFPSLGQENFVMNGDVALDLARWPNNDDGKPFTLNARRNTGGSGPDVIAGAFLTSPEIPSIDWTGGAVFFYGDKPGAGWIAWKAFITNSTSGRIDFSLNKNPAWIRTVHAPADLGDFYLEGVKGALDYQNEWWFDPQAKELFVQLPGGNAPEDGRVRMRRRRVAIDLNNRSFIEIRNLAVFGGSIELKTNSNNNVLYGVSSFYGNHTQGIFTGFNANRPSVDVEGERNSIEKCEIAFSAATGIRMVGSFHELKNSYIHDFNYLGSYDAPLVVRFADDSKVIGNTIFNGGRDGINFNGKRTEVAFNDVYKSNLVADDCGTFYTVGGPQGSEIHHNWFHDIASRGDKFKATGIYLDVDPEDFSVHHNVIWNTEWAGIQINWDALDIDIFNNTFFNNSTVMGAWHKEGTAFSNVRVWNNLGDNDNWEPQSDKRNNHVIDADPFVNSATGDFRIKEGSTSIIDQGVEIPGITDGFNGAAPDIGAYEFNGEAWRAGVDWDPRLGPTGLGCYGLPGENCASDINDLDGDGVPNENDLCPDSPRNEEVDETGCPIVVLSTTGPVDRYFIIVPNPVDHLLRVTSNKQIDGISILNLVGKQSVVRVREDHSIDTSSLRPGVYLLEARFSDNRVEIQKFIKR